MQPKLSIIIPCYNSGQYLPDALESIESYPEKDLYEIIIVNDGSTDELTLKLLVDLQANGYTVLHKTNGGPASARNLGVKQAVGQYLLLLDSDNKVHPDYITKGIQVLESDLQVAVVHAKPHFFGDIHDTARFFQTGSFDLSKILRFNYIDMCSLVRKSVWDSINGQDENRLVIGHEDWDMWIRIGSTAGWKFHYMDEELFEYRIVASSLITHASHEDRHQSLFSYVVAKHAMIYYTEYNKLYNNNLYYHQDKSNPVRSFIKYLYLKYFNKN